MSKLQIPKDLQELYDVASQRSEPDRDAVVVLINRIARLEKELSEVQRTKYGTPCKCKSLISTCATLEEENNTLRKFIAESSLDCIYCGLPKADMSKCSHGFPGCGRADDLLAACAKEEMK